MMTADDRTRTADSAAVAPRSRAGRYLVAGMLAVAVAAAIYAWIYHRGYARRPLELWGGRRADVIASGEEVELLELTPANGPGDAAARDKPTLSFDGRPYRIADRREVGSAPGFSHVRSSLLFDRGFDWRQTSPPSEPAWRYALRFTDGSDRANDSVADTFTIGISIDPPWVALADGASGRAADAKRRSGASIAPMAEAFETFMVEQFRRSRR